MNSNSNVNVNVNVKIGGTRIIIKDNNSIKTVFLLAIMIRRLLNTVLTPPYVKRKAKLVERVSTR